jgi:hypothetical protein
LIRRGKAISMKRTLPAFAVITALILGVGIAFFFLGTSASQERKFGYDPSRYPEVLQEKDFEQADDLAKLYGFIGWDVRAKNMTQLSIGFLALQAFDEETRWPEKERRPKGFQPETWLKIGKEPGLGLRNLHLQSVRGRVVHSYFHLLSGSPSSAGQNSSLWASGRDQRERACLRRERLAQYPRQDAPRKAPAIRGDHQQDHLEEMRHGRRGDRHGPVL